MSGGTLDTADDFALSLTGFSPSMIGFPNTIQLRLGLSYAVRNPENISAPGLAYSAFARHYLRNLG